MSRYPIPQHVSEKVRNWAWENFNFGEWQDRAELVKFFRDQCGYRGDTPNQYTTAFIQRGIKNQDFEARCNSRVWRWIAPDSDGQEIEQ